MPDCHPRQTALFAASLHDLTVNYQHALLLLDLNDPRVACHQSCFQVHRVEEEIEQFAMMTSMVG